MRKRLANRATAAFYWATIWLIRAIITVVGRWKVEGRDRVPKEGGLLVVSNHLNNADPPVLGAGILSRQITFMAKSELF